MAGECVVLRSQQSRWAARGSGQVVTARIWRRGGLALLETPAGGFLGLLVLAKWEAAISLEMAGATGSRKSALMSDLFFFSRRR